MPIWKNKFENTEAYSTSAVGYFTTDSIPDFFVSYAKGVWPNLEWTKQFMINGANGKVEFADSLGYYQTSSSVVFDLNGDGRDEAILNVNYVKLDSLGRKTFYNTLMAVEFGENEVAEMINGLPGHNIASTPWIGDLDNDKMLDIVFCHSNNLFHTYVFDGMQVNRLETSLPIIKTIKWGAYMGSNADGIFK